MLENALVSFIVFVGMSSCGIPWCGILNTGLLLARHVKLGVKLMNVMD